MEQQFPFFPIFIMTSLLFVLTALGIWKNSKITSSTPNLPPGPRKLPIIGNIHQLFGSLPHRRLKDLAKTFGPLMHLQLGEVSAVVISSPEVAKQVMSTHDISFAQRPFILAASIIGYNSSGLAFSPYGETWRKMRKICILKLLSRKSVESFCSIREEEVLHLIRSISSNAGSRINLSKMIFCLTNSVVSRAAFGELSQQQDKLVLLIRDVVKVSGGFSIADVFHSVKLLRVVTGMGAKLKKMHQEVDVILENIINEHRADRATSKSGLKSEAYNLVDVLLNLQGREGHEFSLSTDNIKGFMLDILLGGVETSATVLEWAMSEIIKNPRVMNKAQTEVRQIFEKRKNIDDTSLQELKYLKSVVKETLRLHPPAPLISRAAREQVELNGYGIPFKSQVIVNAWAIGRDRQYWTEADRFYPERFLDSSIDYKGRDFEFIPFGAGRRMCPGILYGMSTVELALANLLYHFDWEIPSGMKPENLDMDEEFGIAVTRKNGLQLIPISYHPS